MQYNPTKTVRASGAYNASLSSTESDSVYNYGALGALISVDQSAIAASSAGGGTGVLTHTVQVRDPLSGNWQSSTGVITGTTGVATWMLACYPGMGTAAPTTVGIGKADLALGTEWRVSTVASSSATNFTYSIGAVPLPTAGTSS